MKHLVKTGFLIGLVLLKLPSTAQHYQAVHGSNLSGSLGMLNNPASSVTSPLPWDVTVFGIQLKQSTNFIYLERYSPTGKDKTLSAFMTNGELKRNWNSQLNLNILNARIRINPRNAIGFGANIRGAAYGKSSTYDFRDSLSSVNSFLSLNRNNQPLSAFFRTSTWAEAFVNYSRNLIDNKTLSWNAGLNLKVNRGFFGMFAAVTNGQFRPTTQNPAIYQLTDGELNYSYSGNTDTWDQGQSFARNFKTYMGNSEGGFSLDLGTEWLIKDPEQRELFTENPLYDYKWKIGISLLDLGYAQYKHGRLSAYTAGIRSNISGTTLANKFDTSIIDLASFNDSLRTVVNTFNPYIRKFSIAHPTRLVLNIDRNISDPFYLNAELSLPLNLLSSAVTVSMRAITTLTLTPRWETRHTGVYLPMNFTGAGDFWVGTAVKTGPLLIGIHNLLPFFKKAPYPNGGGYLALVISPSEQLKKEKAKNIKCPD